MLLICLEVSPLAMGGGRGEGRCRAESRGFWVDKRVADKEKRPRGPGRAEEKGGGSTQEEERSGRVRWSTQTQPHQRGIEGVRLGG